METQSQQNVPTKALGAVRATHLLHAAIVTAERVARATLPIAHGRVAAAPLPDAWTLDLRDHLIFPGLVNAHDHLHLNNFPPLPHREPFPNSYAWMAAFQPYRSDPAVMAAHAVPVTLRYWQGALKNLLCGAATSMHHDPWHPVFDDLAFPVRLLRDYGWSHSLELGGAGGERSRLRYGPSPEESYRATPPNRPWFIHLAEGTDAVASGELNALDTLGCLGANTILIHGVGLTDADRSRVIAHQAGVVWCPGSNLAMLGRTLNPRPIFDAGLLALGSDSRISGAGDLLSELQRAATQSDLTPRELLRLVTTNGSRLLALPEVGGLAPGQAADLVILRDRGGDPYRALLACQRSDIRAVVRAGTPALADPDFAAWFAACGIRTALISIDGHLKLCAADRLGPVGAACLEPGLEVIKA